MYLSHIDKVKEILGIKVVRYKLFLNVCEHKNYMIKKYTITQFIFKKANFMHTHNPINIKRQNNIVHRIKILKCKENSQKLENVSFIYEKLVFDREILKEVQKRIK